MDLDNLNSLIELFFYQSDKQNKKSIFLQWLNPNNQTTYTWEETQKNIFKLSKIIKGRMAELVDAHDSKSCFARSESSILSSPTIRL